MKINAASVQKNKALKIGDVSIETPLFLGPMAGYTNLPFRLIAKEFGAGVVFSEMISGKGLYYKDHKTADLMLTCAAEAPAGIQLFGSDPDILAEVAAMPGGPFCVGFAAESENLLEYAEQKRQRKNLPMLVANLVQNAMNQEDTEITILDQAGTTAFDRMGKDQAAQQIVTHIAQLLNERKI